MICRVFVVVVLDSFVCLISLINLVSFFQWHEKKRKTSNNKWIKISLLSEENCISWPTLPLFAHTTRGYIIKLTLTIIVAGWSICTYMILSQFLFEILHSHPLLHFMVHSLFHSFVRQWQFSFLNLVDIEHDFFWTFACFLFPPSVNSFSFVRDRFLCRLLWSRRRAKHWKRKFLFAFSLGGKIGRPSCVFRLCACVVTFWNYLTRDVG